MKNIALLFILAGGFTLMNAHADDPLKGKNIGVQIDTTSTVPTTPEAKNLKKPMGRCDGKDFYDQASLDGCMKNYMSRSMAPQQVPTQDNAKNIAVPPIGTGTGNGK